MYEICDMHCHILPGIDDGAADMEETIRTLEEAVRQQVCRMIVTPHYYPGRYEAESCYILELMDRVQQVCRDYHLPVTLYPGNECFYFSGLVGLLDSGRVLTLAGSRYVLVEFDPLCMYQYMISGLQELIFAGYRPVLAHFERYSCLQQEEHLLRLKREGVLLQMNFEPLRRRDGFFRKNCWRNLVRDGLVDYLGSDCHGTHFRPLHAQEVISWLYRDVDPCISQNILQKNIKNILERV